MRLTPARTPNRPLGRIGILSLSTMLAVLSVAFTATASQAQFRPGSMSVGPRGGSMMGGAGGFRGTEPRFNRFRSTIPDDSVVVSGKGKGKGRVTVVEPRGDDPRRPGRPRPVRPGIGPVIGGVVTGIAVATPGPSGAAPFGPSPPAGAGTVAQRGGINIPPPNEQRFVKDEVLLEFQGTVTPEQSGAMALRHRLTRLESSFFPQTNTTLFRWKITGGRSVRAVLAQLGGERTLSAAQPNYLYVAAQDAVATPRPVPASAPATGIPAGGDPGQYALSKLRLGEAHSLANGDKILVAVIDSGVDLSHPEIKGAVAGSYDALGKSERPHSHGTAIAGAIAAHARLMGAAPAARILAIRAFGSGSASAEATTMAIVKGLKYATDQKARVVNMSFAGPTDPGLGRHLAAAKANGAVLVAAAGNFGPKSPPQYPAADVNVIAVSATDADDRMFKGSNIGPHVAVSAPGVDILLPAPDNDYQLTSGTSFSAAYVSGVAALVLQRAPGLTPDAVRKILESTARDLGPSGRDPQFGAGLVDAYQAIMAVQANATARAEDVPGPAPAAR